MNRTANKSDRKAKKSYTLSPQTVAFLEMVREKRRAESVSAILEEILQNVRREHERVSVEQAVADYYSSLTDSQAEEQAKWSEFALQEFSKEERA